MTRRLAIARLWHEGNSFSPVPTPLSAFTGREWTAGEAARALYADTGTEPAGALDAVAARPGWEAAFLRCTAAPPGGPVEQAALDTIMDEVAEGLADGGPWDAVYLSLHGAMIGTVDLMPDLSLVRAARRAVGRDVPLGASFDLHANLPPEMAPELDVLTGYRTYPHVDMRETGRRAVALLLEAAETGRRPVVHIEKAGCVLASHGMRTDGPGPMTEIEALCFEADAAPGVHAVTPFGGFAYGDTPAAGASVAVCAADAATAHATAARLAPAFLARRAAFDVSMPDAAEGVERARTAVGAGGPVAVLEPADNPLSGGAGDGTDLFAALMDLPPDVPVVFAFFWDPDLVDRCHAAGGGALLDVSLGGRFPGMGAPVAVRAAVERVTDGRFVNEGPMETGLPVALGRTALLRVQGRDLRVIVTETCQSPNDPGYFRLHGVDLAAVAVLGAKAKNHFRAALGPLCREVIAVDTAGPAASNLGRLPFRHVPAEVLPE